MAEIHSLIDTDFYKFTMGQDVFHNHRGLNATFSLTNRTKSVHLANFINEDELRDELDHVKSLTVNPSEIRFLRGTYEYERRMFQEDYLEFLSKLRLPDYHLEKVGGDYRLEFCGPWCEVMYWETPALSVINRLYFNQLMKGMTRFGQDCVEAEGRKRLQEKIKVLKARPDINFTDFGTRRRFSRAWQEYVVSVMAEELRDQFRGTSNTRMAMDLGLTPMGTSAHELFMMIAAWLDLVGTNKNWLVDAQNMVLNEWWEEYGRGLSIALTDTFGTSFFFRNMTDEQAREWKGLRQDSGHPKVFASRAIRFYKSRGIDPTKKLIVFSDGLDVGTITGLADYCRSRILCTFGWGTDLTNDLGFATLSLVIKAIAANGKGTVKLSDNIAKAIGDPGDIERYKKAAGYERHYSKQCRS